MTDTIELSVLSADWLQPLQTLLLTGALHLMTLQPSASYSRYLTGPQLTVCYHPLSCKHQTCCLLKLLCLFYKPAAGLHCPWVAGSCCCNAQ